MANVTLKVAMRKSTPNPYRVDSKWGVKLNTHFSIGYENFRTKIEGV